METPTTYERHYGSFHYAGEVPAVPQTPGAFPGYAPAAQGSTLMNTGMDTIGAPRRESYPSMEITVPSGPTPKQQEATERRYAQHRQAYQDWYRTQYVPNLPAGQREAAGGQDPGKLWDTWRQQRIAAVAARTAARQASNRAANAPAAEQARATGLRLPDPIRLPLGGQIQRSRNERYLTISPTR